MTESLKEIFIALGIVLGLLSPRTDPDLRIRIYRGEENLNYSLEIENCLNEDSMALVEASSTLMVKIKIFKGRNQMPYQTIYHTISRDLLSGIYTVYYSPSNSYHRTTDSAAAYQIFREFFNLPLLSLSEFEDLSPRTFRFRADISLVEAENYDASVLWNYHRPERIFNYKSIKEIPY